jgi:RNA polymerase sigma-70 factor (ECF subfamily)
MHGTEEAVEAHELEHMINEFMHRLSERDCNVFLRRYYYLEEYSVISERYGLNINTVKTSLHRTRDKLREYLEKEGVVL